MWKSLLSLEITLVNRETIKIKGLLKSFIISLKVAKPKSLANNVDKSENKLECTITMHPKLTRKFLCYTGVKLVSHLPYSQAVCSSGVCWIKVSLIKLLLWRQLGSSRKTHIYIYLKILEWYSKYLSIAVVLLTKCYELE